MSIQMHENLTKPQQEGVQNCILQWNSSRCIPSQFSYIIHFDVHLSQIHVVAKLKQHKYDTVIRHITFLFC